MAIEQDVELIETHSSLNTAIKHPHFLSYCSVTDDHIIHEAHLQKTLSGCNYTGCRVALIEEKIVILHMFKKVV